MQKRFQLSAVIALCFIIVFQVASAQETPDSVVSANSRPRLNLVQRVFKYFDETNKPKPHTRFDFSIAGGPGYSVSKSVQLAVMGAAQYKSRVDSLTPISNASVFLQGSVTGFYSVGVEGVHYGPEDKYRINYNTEFAHFPLDFWGIGYETECQDVNKTSYTELRIQAWADFQFRLKQDVYFGPSLNFQSVKATKVTRPELWNGADLQRFNYNLGIGFIFSIDTRDVATNARSGINLNIKQYFFPRLGSVGARFGTSELTFGAYRRLWRDAVIAGQIHGMFTYGDTPWYMLPSIDNGKSMRGYYQDRYRDKNEADIVIELRQHVWKRLGLVAWGGVGAVFRHFPDVRSNTLLPSYGIGARFEFKKNVNVRVDYGIGKHSSALSLGLYEVF